MLKSLFSCFFADELNGNFAVSQDLDVITPPQFYATNQLTMMNASITDVFNESNLTYYWRFGPDDKLVGVTNTSGFNFTFPKAGDPYGLSCEVVATVSQDGFFVNITREFDKIIFLRGIT